MHQRHCEFVHETGERCPKQTPVQKHHESTTHQCRPTKRGKEYTATLHKYKVKFSQTNIFYPLHFLLSGVFMKFTSCSTPLEWMGNMAARITWPSLWTTAESRSCQSSQSASEEKRTPQRRDSSKARTWNANILTSTQQKL